MTRDSKIKALFVFLVLSASSARGIPFLTPWGVDLANVLAYQNCTGTRNPYLISGYMCGDPFGRALVYPPLLLHSFAWLRDTPLETAMYRWTIVSCALLLGSLYLWKWLARPVRVATWQVAVFCGLLLLQYPMVFLLERGGTDVPPVLLWTLAAATFAGGELMLSGVFAGLAAAFKLYPAIPALVIGIALLLRQPWSWRIWETPAGRFGFGCLGTFLAVNACFGDESKVYFLATLPAWSPVLSSPFAYAHSIYAFAGAEHTLYPKCVLLLLTALWCWSASRSIATRPVGTFAGVLAISTYFAGTTYDYNLVTTYPLLLWCFLEACRSDRWATVALGLVAIAGDRLVFSTNLFNYFNPPNHLALELAWLLVAAIDLARPNADETAASAPLAELPAG